MRPVLFSLGLSNIRIGTEIAGAIDPIGLAASFFFSREIAPADALQRDARYGAAGAARGRPGGAVCHDMLAQA